MSSDLQNVSLGQRKQPNATLLMALTAGDASNTPNLNLTQEIVDDVGKHLIDRVRPISHVLLDRFFTFFMPWLVVVSAVVSSAVSFYTSTVSDSGLCDDSGNSVQTSDAQKALLLATAVFQLVRIVITSVQGYRLAKNHVGHWTVSDVVAATKNDQVSLVAKTAPNNPEVILQYTWLGIQVVMIFIFHYWHSAIGTSASDVCASASAVSPARWAALAPTIWDVQSGGHALQHFAHMYLDVLLDRLLHTFESIATVRV